MKRQTLRVTSGQELGREKLWHSAYQAFQLGETGCDIQRDGVHSSLPLPDVLRVLAESGRGQGLVSSPMTWRQFTFTATSLTEHPSKISPSRALLMAPK